MRGTRWFRSRLRERVTDEISEKGRRKQQVLVGPPKYRNRHSGRDFLVLGNGPSLRTHAGELQALIAEEDPVILGANHVTPFMHPDYHAFANRKRFAAYARTIDPSRSRVLLGPYIAEELIRAHYAGPWETLAYISDHDASFDVVEGVIQASCRTVSVLLIGVAVVMGARRIRVAGLDGFSAGGPSHHTEMESLKTGADYRDSIELYTRRFLGEISRYMLRQGLAPFTIITPTGYEEHYDPSLLAAYARK